MTSMEKDREKTETVRSNETFSGKLIVISPDSVKGVAPCDVPFFNVYLWIFLGYKMKCDLSQIFICFYWCLKLHKKIFFT